VNACIASRNRACQYLSMGELPITTTILVVSGSSFSTLSTARAKSFETATTLSLAVNALRSTCLCSTPCALPARKGKKPLRFRWKVNRRRADGDDQVELSLDKESVQIIDKRTLLVPRRNARFCERRLEMSRGSFDAAPALSRMILAYSLHGAKSATEGMQKHDPLRLRERLARHREE